MKVWKSESGLVTLYCGDCRDIIPSLPKDFTAIVTDPPAGISFMGKEWDTDHGGRDNWISGFAEIAKMCLGLCLPGAHALVWALPRTSHWTATAWENGGWEVRDRVAHVFGSGFPKSLDVSKAIDKMKGVRRKVIGISQHKVVLLTGIQDRKAATMITFQSPNRRPMAQSYGTATVRH